MPPVEFVLGVGDAEAISVRSLLWLLLMADTCGLTDFTWESESEQADTVVLLIETRVLMRGDPERVLEGVPGEVSE